MENGHRSPWEVVKWARDLWRLHDRMGKLRGGDGKWLAGDLEIVGALVGVIMGNGDNDCIEKVTTDGDG